MKPSEWTEEKLQALVATQAPESLTLEYKASEALAKTDVCKNELSKDVSAFANSAGGTIVYGMRENRDTHAAECLDLGCDPAVVSSEWIEQVVNSRIQQRIDGVRITEVRLVQNSPGRVAFVIDVPQSSRAPHQAGDKRFYRRFNLQSVPMEEYEIRDIARRQVAPDLGIQFHPVLDGLAQGRDPRYKPFRVVLTNESDVPCEFAAIEIQLDCGLKLANGRWMKTAYNSTFDKPDGTIPLVAYRFSWTSRDGLPAFRECPVFVPGDTLVVDTERTKPGSFLARWRVLTPRAPPRDGFSVFDWDGKGAYGFRFRRLSEDEAFAEPKLHWLTNGAVVSFEQ